MKNLIVAFIVAIILSVITLSIIHLSVTAFTYNKTQSRECLTSITSSFSNTPNETNHLGVPVETTCIQWSK